MQGNPTLFCMRHDWTTYRFVVPIPWVASDVTTLLASGPHLARFSAFDVTAPLSRGPHLGRFGTELEVQLPVRFKLDWKCNFTLLDG